MVLFPIEEVEEDIIHGSIRGGDSVKYTESAPLPEVEAHLANHTMYLNSITEMMGKMQQTFQRIEENIDCMEMRNNTNNSINTPATNVKKYAQALESIISPDATKF